MSSSAVGSEEPRVWVALAVLIPGTGPEGARGEVRQSPAWFRDRAPFIKQPLKRPFSIIPPVSPPTHSLKSVKDSQHLFSQGWKTKSQREDQGKAEILCGSSCLASHHRELLWQGRLLAQPGNGNISTGNLPEKYMGLVLVYMALPGKAGFVMLLSVCC